jgi:hypothetical protein
MVTGAEIYRPWMFAGTVFSRMQLDNLFVTASRMPLKRRVQATEVR